MRACGTILEWNSVLAPEDFVIAIGVEGRIDVDQIDAGVGKLGELFEPNSTTFAAIDDKGGGFARRRRECRSEFFLACRCIGFRFGVCPRSAFSPWV